MSAAPLTHTHTQASERACLLPCHSRTFSVSDATLETRRNDTICCRGKRLGSRRALGGRVTQQLVRDSVSTAAFRPPSLWMIINFFFKNHCRPNRRTTSVMLVGLCPPRFLSGRAGRCHFMPYDYSRPHVSLNERPRSYTLAQLPINLQFSRGGDGKFTFCGIFCPTVFLRPSPDSPSSQVLGRGSISRHCFTRSTHLLHKRWGNTLFLKGHNLKLD